jgi:thioredoxin
MTVHTATADNLEGLLKDNDILLLDFWASWCGPCQSFGPIFEQAAEDNPEVGFAKVNTEEEQALAGHFQVRSIPTLMVFRERILLFNQAGALPRQALDELITKVKDLDMDEVRAEVEKAEQEANGQG